MAKYAADTSVSVEQSRGELERILARYGAGSFMYGWDGDKAVIAFQMGERFAFRQVRFVLPMPQMSEFAFTESRGLRRSASAQTAAWEQAQRQRWRALTLLVKAKLEAVESGIETFDQAFLPHIMLPNGETVGDWLAEPLERAYVDREMPQVFQLALPRGGK